MSARGSDIHSVVVATDGSPTAEAALQFVAALPLRAGTDVLLLSVMEGVLAAHEIERLGTEQRAAFGERVGELRAEVAAFLESEAALLRASGHRVTTEVRTGHPAAEIVAASGRHDADLVVVGSHGRSGLKRFLLGSVSNRVLGSAERSVLVVRAPERDRDRHRGAPSAGAGHPWRIMVAVDGSTESERAVDFCAGLDLDERTSIRLLTVVPVVTMFRQDIGQELDAVWQERKSAQEAALEGAADRLRQQPTAVTTALVEAGDVSQAILAAADEFDADLIVVGHKGKGAIEQFLMGSVTTRIAHHADRSVLVVR